MNEQDWQAYFERSTSGPVRAAAQIVKTGLSEVGLTPSTNTGHVTAVRFHDEYNRYLFSFILNKPSLLFYVRLPSLKVSTVLAAQPRQRFAEVRSNPAGETTIRIVSPNDAAEVVAWLSAALPLPYGN